MTKHNYNILAISKANLPNQYLDNRFVPADQQTIQNLTQKAILDIRHKLETEYETCQLIPYIGVICNGKILTYRRGHAGADSRLHDKYSLGVGGHVDEDPDHTGDYFELLMQAAVREIAEEIDLHVSPDQLTITGTIYHPLTDIDKVHLGVGMILEVSDLDLSRGEQDVLVERNLHTAQQVQELHPKLETWSAVFFDHYLKNHPALV